MACPKCGFDNPQSFNFCGRCGSPTAATSRLSEVRKSHSSRAERRQLSVLFCDLVGSTSLSSELDPEEFNDVLREYQSACAEVVERHEGCIAQFLGDGLLVYFGYPLSHEDDAPRAVRAGLEIVDAITSVGVRLGKPLQVRVAVHTGLVVVGHLGGETNPDPMAILGETPNIAARLQAIARPGAVVISDATYRLVKGYFICRGLGTPALKGVSASIEAFEVAESTGVNTRFENAVASGLTAFVSREKELSQLLEHWREACEGKGQVVMLSGEAGIGKSRLVKVLKERTADEPLWELGCRCSPYYQNSALYPAIEYLQRILRFDRDDEPQDKLKKLERALAGFGFDLSASLPLFAALLSLPDNDRYPAPPMTPQRQKHNTFEGLIEWLMRCAQRGAVRLVIEDLHWADPSTLEWIGFLLERVPAARLLLILVFRPEFVPPWPLRSHMASLNLGRLPPAATESMIQAVAGGKQLPSKVVGDIVAKTEGVPLFVEELTQMVLESGMLQEHGDHYSLPGALPALEIPSTLYDSLMARLDRLGTAKEVAQLAATIGREFSYELLRAISPLEETRLTGALNRLVDAELLYQRVFASQTLYTFRHALIRDVAYESLLRSKRRHYHAEIGTVLKERFPETIDSHPELLASHYTYAGLAKMAIPMWQKAGLRALERSANQEAIRHLTNGLELLGRLPETPEHRRQELILRATLGPAMMAAKGFASIEAQNVYARARKLCQEIGEGSLPFQVSWALWVSHAARGELQPALEAAQECLRLAELAQHPAQLVAACHAMGASMACFGRFRKALDHFEHGWAVYNPRHHADIVSLCGQDSGVVCLAYHAWPLWFLGYPDQARKHVGEAVSLAHKLGHPLTTVTVANLACWTYPLLRDPMATLQQAELALTLSTEHLFEFWRALALLARAWALNEQGMLNDAIPQLRAALTDLRSSGDKIMLNYYMATLADALRKAGRAEEALDWLAEAQATVEETGDNWWEPELLRLKAETIRGSFGHQRDDEAEAFAREALAIAGERRARSLELRAATSLGRLLIRRGQKSEAHQTVSAVYNWFTEGFDTPDLREARTLIGEIESAS